MTKIQFNKSLGLYLLGIGKKAFEAIKQFPEEWDMRHIMKLILVLVENPSLSIEEVIKKLKIADAALTGKNWIVDKDQGDILLTEEERKFNKEAINEAL